MMKDEKSRSLMSRDGKEREGGKDERPERTAEKPAAEPTPQPVSAQA